MIRLPEDVKKIIDLLKSHGFAAYAVGGCIRDSLIGREPNDWDITTEALPEDVKRIFFRTVDTGIEHGTVTVFLKGKGYEVTTYRIDGDYADSRHPESVTFTRKLSEDLLRRDFTINAMAYNNEDGLVDLFGGQEDLAAGIIRAVGVPEERFSEDALRIMRCVRFAAQLGYTIEPATLQAAKKLSGNLSLISRERVREELVKTLCSKHPDYVDILSRIGAMAHFYPEYEALRAQILPAYENLPEEPIPRIAAFFAPSGAFRADELLKELRFDNDTRNRVVRIAAWKDRKVEDDRAAVRRAVSEFGKEDFELFLIYTKQEHLRGLFRDILASGECTSLKEMKLTGRDLIDLGMKPGKGLGEVLKQLLDLVLADPEMNDRDRLLIRAKEIAEKTD